MHKLCYKACIENVTIVHGYRLWECITMVTCITCVILSYKQYFLFTGTHTFMEKQQLGAVLTIHKLNYAWHLFSHGTHLHGFIHSHINLVGNNTVSFNSQLNGLITTLGTVYPSLNGLRLSAHLAGITQSSTI